MVTAVGVAAYAAAAIKHVAGYDLGFSPREICGAAVIVGSLIAAALVVDFVNNLKQP